MSDRKYRERQTGHHLIGPYKHHDRWRYFTVGADGSKTPSKSFATRQACEDSIEEEQRTLDGKSDLTVSDALERYEIFLRAKGWRERGLQDLLRRYDNFFAGHRDRLLEELNTKLCAAMYEDLRTRAVPRSIERCQRAAAAAKADWATHPIGASPACLCKPYAAATQRMILNQARMFLTWCVKHDLIPANPLTAVEGIGKVRKGKPQLRIDESRRWLEMAHHYASMRGTEPIGEGAVGAMMTILMGLRASNVVNIHVRDIDDNGRRLFIGDEGNAGDNIGKTESTEDWYEIPEELQPYLAALCTGKKPTDLIWNRKHWRDWPRENVQRICVAAGVKVVTAHGMRGLHAALTYLGGEGEAQAAAQHGLRHDSFGMTKTYLLNADGLKRATQRRALKALKGGL